jgi:hypothetical protein
MVTRRAILAGFAGVSVLIVAGCQSPTAERGAKPANLAPFTGRRQGTPAVVFPAFVTAAVRDGYEFAVARPDVLSVLPCYCGCGLSSGHSSNLDCFVAGVDKSGAIVMDDHGSGCETCLDIARDAKTLVAQGRTLPEIRKLIDERHGDKGPGTDTPKPRAGAVPQTG